MTRARGLFLKMAEGYVPRQGSGFPPYSPPFLLVVWYFYRDYLATLVNKDSQVSVDSVLEKPSKAGMESRKGSFPNPVFLLFNLE